MEPHLYTLLQSFVKISSTSDDGSEFSPDGKHIYFNSNRTGNMQLWKMNSDGSNPKQLTFDTKYKDWFPHVSPDGKWLAFISPVLQTMRFTFNFNNWRK